jgi:hypothetical protein
MAEATLLDEDVPRRDLPPFAGVFDMIYARSATLPAAIGACCTSDTATGLSSGS